VSGFSKTARCALTIPTEFDKENSKKQNPHSLWLERVPFALAGMFNVPRKLSSNRHGTKCPCFADSCQQRGNGYFQEFKFLSQTRREQKMATQHITNM
jgi:hypothetical protein